MAQYKSGSDQIRRLVNNDQKFNEKLENKDFLMGKYQTTIKAKLEAKRAKPKKLDKSRFRKMLLINYKCSKQQSTVPNTIKYQCFLPLNRLWNQYMTSLIAEEQVPYHYIISDECSSSPQSVLLKVLRADLHGAFITVLQSKMESYEGAHGIVVRETLRSFQVVSSDNRIMTLLKQNSLFLVQTRSGQAFKVFGCNLLIRPTERIKYKFKYRVASQFVLKNS